MASALPPLGAAGAGAVTGLVRLLRRAAKRGQPPRHEAEVPYSTLRAPRGIAVFEKQQAFQFRAIRHQALSPCVLPRPQALRRRRRSPQQSGDGAKDIAQPQDANDLTIAGNEQREVAAPDQLVNRLIH